ncbi:iron complex transport system substrate-binding protein [Halarchaeum rubridurum]|uniref:Cobalamin-binding protein n=1 Tax=Halarchaeum rubridurum TaxID=489911 RepID=A0A830FZQ4_9EURY|nr:helical backbone metal receptor [Halarchaeum rubridurum]MBP1955198.1 iron complex transport system substrate-binding protein [Halarchaeum rubridurum]GGM68209.1 cobalamin-binding protein [Halarchaeum rubridurum]
MRVCSLAPAATATVVALGAEADLVGVTHNATVEVDAPPVGGWLNPDYDRLADVDPDVVLTGDALQRDVRDELDARGYDVRHREPTRLADVLAGFAARGNDVGRAAAGERLEADCRARVERVREAVAGAERPTVYCEEWDDPPMAAGNWVPDAVRAAGGRHPFVEPGARSREVEREVVEDADPDHVVAHYCGRGGRGGRARPDFDARGWDVDAAVHVLDDALLNQPSPALVDGIEALARRLHPERA